MVNRDLFDGLSIDDYLYELDDGTTGASYSTSIYRNVERYAKKIITILNNSATETMYYKIEAGNYGGGYEKEIKAETSIPTTDKAVHSITDGWRFIKISVKNNSGACSYTVILTGVPK